MFSLSYKSLIVLLLTATLAYAKNPHGENFSMKCDLCHNSSNWSLKAKGFDHKNTAFPLVGQHKMASCKQCHPTLAFNNAKTDCASCHKDMHQMTVGRNCDRCHTPNAWVVKNIKEIHQRTRFPLVGQHAIADCQMCHKSASRLRFDPMGTKCNDCHAAQYLTAPDHVSGNYSRNCEQCHQLNDRTWRFNHLSFPLVDGHKGVSCDQCHGIPHKKVSPDCYSCHKNNFLATSNPKHALSGFSTDCKTCHNLKGWQPSSFNHNTSTSFQLKGGHVGVACNKCHLTGYKGTSKECVNCHLPKYNATTNPPHVTSNFSKDCATCHNVNAWQPATFNHNTATTFPLQGMHIGVACVKCHTTGYKGTPKTCVSCHLTNYNATTNPRHSAAKFATTCETCHKVNGWKPTTFNHNTATTFALTGSHLGLSCSKCHTTVFAGLSTACQSCHATAYATAKSKVNGHLNAFNSFTCIDCHNTSGWHSIKFTKHTTNRTRIYSSPHKGRWSACSDCHVGNIYPTYSCRKCHGFSQ